ncbi:helix-turn-helix domain-containing protein [Enterococcus pingfangensis]|uniref:helix-turn-helix domain-containing protein n=1 Tax=Enterococcus pingfangensis TaxID=2559924 RepID=UPI001484F725|nr:helix-turn-helix domain-containing protein [Enterococcus pingfangensis]
MYRGKILDSWDEKQYNLLTFLHKNNFSATKEECLHTLNLNVSVLNNLIVSLESLASESGLFSISKQGRILTISIPFDKNLDDIFHYLLLSSIKYQIISELFHKETLHIPNIEQKLGISYSTFYRKLVEINVILAEFDIKIENKKLIGSELQIRHFFVEFYTMTRTWKSTSEQFSDKVVFDEIIKLNNQFQLELSDIAIGRIVAYLMIVKFRYLQKKVVPVSCISDWFFDDASFNRFVDSLVKSPLYEPGKLFMKKFFSAYGIVPKGDEPLALILFLMGKHILSDDSILYKDLIAVEAEADLMTYAMKNKLLDCFNDHQIISSNQQDELTYLLTQVTWHHCFFKGWIVTEDSQITPEQFEKVAALFDTDDFIADFFADHFPDVTHKIDVLDYYKSDLYQLILYFLKGNFPGLSIGVHIEGDLLMKRILTPMIIKRLNCLDFITASTLKKGVAYDLVVSNVNFPAIENQGKHFYLINHEFYSSDFQHIEEFISMIVNAATFSYNRDLK